MGERAQRGYEDAERQAFRDLPRAQRIKATLAAIFFTGAVAVALFLIFAFPSFAQQQIVGVASVIDGDTIEIHGERIRFNGIDAPESAQLCKDGRGHDYRCGAVSANALAAFLTEAQPTRCEFIERDRYGRFVGDCYRVDGVSVAATMVRSGLALDWPQYSNGAFAREQAAAKRERRGLCRVISKSLGAGGRIGVNQLLSRRWRRVSLGQAETVESRAIFRGKANTSAMSQGRSITPTPGSASARASAGSAPKARHRPLGGERREDRKLLQWCRPASLFVFSQG